MVLSIASIIVHMIPTRQYLVSVAVAVLSMIGMEMVRRIVWTAVQMIQPKMHLVSVAVAYQMTMQMVTIHQIVMMFAT
jgi:uncharacterized membrane protein YqjE